MRRAGIGVLFVTLSACSTMAVNSDYDPDADFSLMQSYRWLMHPEPRVDDPRVNNTLLDKRVRAAVDRVLATKGMSYWADGEVDFIVGYHVTLDTRKTVRVLNDYYRYGPGWGYHYDLRYRPYYWPGAHTYVYEYDEGTLIIDIVAPDTRALLWRGSARDRVNFQATPEERVAKINEAVERILDQFPPRQR